MPQPSAPSIDGTCRTNTTTQMSCCSVSSSGLMEECCLVESLVSVPRSTARSPSVCRWLTEQVCSQITNQHYQRDTSQRSPSHSSTAI
ncbi:uncharacterized protein [Oncorhynchus clarkii lewisi]|uniref:uncharacterized protein isoform X1 n=1 Tax=Oncorhynchus clarkii lewisi TaxID=490388 RepID=UPI0039B9BAF5